MKSKFLKIASIVLVSLMFTSCYVNKFDIGKGAQGNQKVKQMNAYLIGGLIPLSTAQPQLMAGGAENYTVTIKQSFVDGVISAITGGIFTPTTTVVRK